MDLHGVELNYKLRRTNISKINLKVDKDGIITVCAPPEATTEEIETFIRHHEKNILTSLEKYKEKHNIVSAGDNSVRTAEDFSKLVNMFLYKYYNVMKEHNQMPEFPQIKYRQMRQSWAHYNEENGTIVVNLRLASKPKEAVEFIIVQALSHMVVKGKGSEFFEFVEIYLPDWKRKKKLLNEGWNPQTGE